MTNILWIIAAVLFILWLVGLAVEWTASLVWILFVAAVVVLLISLFSTRGRYGAGVSR